MYNVENINKLTNEEIVEKMEPEKFYSFDLPKIEQIIKLMKKKYHNNFTWFLNSKGFFSLNEC